MFCQPLTIHFGQISNKDIKNAWSNEATVQCTVYDPWPHWQSSLPALLLSSGLSHVLFSLSTYLALGKLSWSSLLSNVSKSGIGIRNESGFGIFCSTLHNKLPQRNAKMTGRNGWVSSWSNKGTISDSPGSKYIKTNTIHSFPILRIF